MQHLQRLLTKHLQRLRQGNWEYFLSYVRHAACLHLRGVAPDGSAMVDMDEGWQLVFGGDAVDKGGPVGGSVRVVRSLLRLRRRYPTRVTLLLGNRDLNKMRCRLPNMAATTDAVACLCMLRRMLAG